MLSITIRGALKEYAESLAHLNNLIRVKRFIRVNFVQADATKGPGK